MLNIITALQGCCEVYIGSYLEKHLNFISLLKGLGKPGALEMSRICKAESTGNYVKALCSA